MLKVTLNRVRRTFEELLYTIAPVWHLTNLRREAVDQLQDLHYQIGLCGANKNQINERIEEIGYLLDDPDIDKETIFALKTEKRQLEARLREIIEMGNKAEDFLHTYEDSLPKIVSQLDMAIQMTRQAKSQKYMAKMLTDGTGTRSSNVNDHIKKVRAQAYAVNAQISSLALVSKSKKTKMLPK